MSRRAVWLALVAVALGAVLAWLQLRPRAVGPERTEAATAAQRALAPPVAERLARLDARLRLPPDRRAIAALGELRRLIRGGPAAEADVAWASGSWKVRCDGELLGVLSPLPRFDALLALLDSRAAKERSRPGAVQLDPDVKIRPELHDLLNHFDDASAFAVLAAVDAGWRSGQMNASDKTTVGDLLAATEALAQLALILPRDSAAADRLAARGLASLALARQYAPDRALRAEVSLAWALGYVEHAVGAAGKLPRDEPLAAFVRRDFGALERLAEWSKSDDVHFYYAARLVWARSDEDWLVWYRGLPPESAASAAVVGTGLEESSAMLGRVVPELYATALFARVGASPGSQPLARCDALRSSLAEKAQALRGPFADAALYTDSYHAACLAAVYRKLASLALEQSDPGAALALAKSLPQEPLREWTELASADATRRSTAIPRFAQTLAGGSELGLEPRRALALPALGALSADDPRRSEIADALARRLDTRPEARAIAADLARDVYLEPDLEEKLAAATLDVDRLERPLLAARHASFSRDWLTLWSMAEGDGFRMNERMAACEALEAQKPLESLRLRRAYERLLTAHPSDEPLRRQFARYLEKSLQSRKAAREVLLPILAAHEGSDPASDSAAGIIARLYREDGKPTEAWELLEPRLSGMRVPYEAARAQLALGNRERAEEIARDAYAHYPRSLAPAAELAAVLWESGKNAAAAEVIAKFPAAASDKDRCFHFCRAFVRTFRGKPPADVEAAFAELVAAKLDYALLQGTIETFRETAEPETALVLSQKVDARAALEARTESYKTLKQMRGEAEAMAWLSKQLPRDQLGAAAKIFYARDVDELLWKLVDDPDKQGGSTTWLMRAAAFAREEHPSFAHRQALVAYFTAHQTTPDEQLGAALVGLIDAQTLLERARSEAELSRAAYHLGARAESARDLRGAVRMYQLALASRLRTPGRAQALAAMTRIQELHLSLDVLEANPALAVAQK